MSKQLLSAFEELINKLNGWVEALILNIPNIVIALAIFFLAYYLSSKFKKAINIALQSKISQDSVRNLLANITSIVVISLGIFLALGVLNLDKALTSILAGAGVAGLAIGLALQGTLSNTFSGILLAIKDIVNEGDWIETNGYAGNVDGINLRYLRLREADNNIVILPNKMVLDNAFKNYGLTQQIRTTVKCGVGYGSDLEHVKTLAVETIKSIFPEPEGKPIEFHYLEFGDSSINFQLRFWLDAKASITLLEARSRAIIAIKKCFDKEGINIPFPIRTLMIENKSENTSAI